MAFGCFIFSYASALPQHLSVFRLRLHMLVVSDIGYVCGHILLLFSFVQMALMNHFGMIHHTFPAATAAMFSFSFLTTFLAFRFYTAVNVMAKGT
ncbi:transmembrane protein, putative [Medicago truncatula]|uniref:Transmembrane protein, putative n=1 Tax=Medicago truncatula TaxID=3880 RepID=G7KCX2_MEDTR|nr:transmembrane protein, putative [Medicago truncatula]